MAFLRNAWYAAAWENELANGMVARTILGEPIVVFRTESGRISAIQDRCPHRFVPLHRGKVRGEVIECGYHGLCFSGDGACTSNPHGNKAIPRAAVVKSYPVEVRHKAVWVWMGAPATADPALISDFSHLDSGSSFVPVFGYVHVRANYQLIADNLLDLTHGQYLHPIFKNPAGPLVMEDSPFDDNTVWAKFARRNQFPNQYFQMLGYPADQRGDHRNFMRWNPPGNMLLDVGMTSAGGLPSEGLSIPTAHLLTPETETTTHYLWSMARDFRRDDSQLSRDLMRIGMDIFNNEDKPTIECQQVAMGSETDIFKLRPVLLPTDGPAIRARRLLAEKIAHEQAAHSQPAAESNRT